MSFFIIIVKDANIINHSWSTYNKNDKIHHNKEHIIYSSKREFEYVSIIKNIIRTFSSNTRLLSKSYRNCNHWFSLKDFFTDVSSIKILTQWFSTGGDSPQGWISRILDRIFFLFFFYKIWSLSCVFIFLSWYILIFDTFVRID